MTSSKPIFEVLQGIRREGCKKELQEIRKIFWKLN
jgi:hypothetical protein